MGTIRPRGWRTTQKLLQDVVGEVSWDLRQIGGWGKLGAQLIGKGDLLE